MPSPNEEFSEIPDYRFSVPLFRVHSRLGQVWSNPRLTEPVLKGDIQHSVVVADKVHVSVISTKPRTRTAKLRGALAQPVVCGVDSISFKAGV